MSQLHSTPSQTKPKGHLTETERRLNEKWLNEDVYQTEIGNRLRRDRSTICREIKRGTTTQLRQGKRIEVYFADTGQTVYNKKPPKQLLKKHARFFWTLLAQAKEILPPETVQREKSDLQHQDFRYVIQEEQPKREGSLLQNGVSL